MHGGTGKIITGQNGQPSGVVPYLPLNELPRRAPTPQGGAQPQPQQGATIR